MYPNMANKIAAPIKTEMGIIMNIQICLISQLNLDYKENSGKKGFSCKSKHQYCASQCGEQDSGANNKKNGDYYEHPILSHFMDEH